MDRFTSLFGVAAGKVEGKKGVVELFIDGVGGRDPDTELPLIDDVMVDRRRIQDDDGRPVVEGDGSTPATSPSTILTPGPTYVRRRGRTANLSSGNRASDGSAPRSERDCAARSCEIES